MKIKINALLAIAGLLVLTGCIGPLYTKEGQHPKGQGFGLFGSGAASRAQVDRMAIQKLQAQPVQVEVATNGVFRGYVGIIANLSDYPRLRFTYDGPEHGVEVLSQGEQIVKPLLPGVYNGEIFHGGTRVGWIQFVSEPQEKGFMGKRYHWIFYAERW